MKIYTVKELAKLLRVSTSTIYRYIEEGELPAVKVGKQFRISAKQLDRLFADAPQAP